MKEEINTMPKTSLYNMEGAAIGEVELSEELFAAPINTAAMHLVVRSILANQRQGTQSALTRGEVERLAAQRGTDPESLHLLVWSCLQGYTQLIAVGATTADATFIRAALRAVVTIGDS